MSQCTTVVLSWGIGEKHEARLAELNAWLTGPGDQSKGLADLGKHFGGTKAPQVTVVGGAFNYLDLKGLVACIEGLKWRDRDCVALYVNDENESNLAPRPLWGRLPEVVPE